MSEKEENYKTYNEWKKCGYCVLKGEKSTKKNQDNEPIFGLAQVGNIKSEHREDEWFEDWYWSNK